jgi:hypothetical protein
VPRTTRRFRRRSVVQHNRHSDGPLPNQLECRVDDGPSFLLIEILDQVHRSLDVGEQHCDRLALTFDVVGRGRVGYQDRWGYGLPVPGRCMRSERGSAFPAELLALRIHDGARWAPQLELGSTLGAKHRVHEILGIALAHRIGFTKLGLRT